MAISHEADHALEILPVPPTPFRSPIARPRRASVSRASLVERLESGTRRKLTVLMAPAGWGKTSLLAEWMATTAQPLVWLPLEARDNEPARALRLLATAINQSTPGLADDLLAALRSPYPPAVDDLIAMLIGAISLSNTSFVLVIDDVQHLTDPELQHALQALVTGVPDSVRFVLSGRADPPLNLSRWRVLGEVTDIRIDDLRFDASETARFFAQLPDLEVGEGGLETILTRTEGWAAGLQMAGLALRGRRIDDRTIAEFRGTQREVAGFLCEEVFSCQAADMRRFLMQISVFDKVSGTFCDAVLSRSDSRHMLEQATEANLFVSPIDAGRQRFRMHPLFRDYLVSELERENPRAVRDLHRRAAAWLIENDLVMEAIDHLIVAGETEQSIDLIDRLSTNMVLTSEHTTTFLRWVEMFPRETVVSKQRMLRFYVQALTLTGRLAEAEALVAEMIAHPFYQNDPAQPDNARRQAGVLSVQSRISAYRGDDQRTIELASQALDLLAGSDPAWRASLEMDLGWAWRSLGELDHAADHFAKASRLGWETTNLQSALWGTRYLALSWLAQGRLREAIALVDSELERATSVAPNLEALQACLLITRGELLQQQFRLPEARTSLERGLHLASQTLDAKILMNGHVALALVEEAEGNLETAMLMLRRGTRIFNGPQEAALGAGLALMAGQTATALHWAQSSGLTAADGFLPSRGPAEQVTFAHVLLVTGKPDQAVALLERLLAETTERGWFGRAIELQVQLALALLRTGERDRALATLIEGIRTAAPEGYVREFVEGGPEIFGLLRDAMRSRASLDREFVTHVLSFRPSTDESDVSQTGLAESLTDRQLDVLRLLAAGRSNRAIADELYLAEGTVKAHVHQISTKLLARNRTEAVARARDLGLLG